MRKVPKTTSLLTTIVSKKILHKRTQNVDKLKLKPVLVGYVDLVLQHILDNSFLKNLNSPMS